MFLLRSLCSCLLYFYIYFYAFGETLVSISSEGFVLGKMPLWLSGMSTTSADIHRCVVGVAGEFWFAFVGGGRVRSDSHAGHGRHLSSVGGRANGVFTASVLCAEVTQLPRLTSQCLHTLPTQAHELYIV